MLSDRTWSTAPEVPERRQCLLSGGFWLVRGMFNFVDCVPVCLYACTRVSARVNESAETGPISFEGLGE